MTIRLQNRAFQACYERQYFGFHSLRSGFLTTALIKAGDDNTARTRELEQTATVARWVLYSAVEMKYVKSAAIAIHVANRLVLPDTELHATNVVEPILATSEIFHNMKLQPIPWTGGELLSSFKEQITMVLSMSCTLLGQGPTKFHALKAKATRNFCVTESIPLSDFELHVQNCLMKDQTPISLANHFLRGSLRKRKYWLEWELKALSDGRAANKSWDEISQAMSEKCDLKKKLLTGMPRLTAQSKTGVKRGVASLDPVI
ncbi:hypothetical protein BLNAU_19372 [Blattamonas nauphoetae]|uniref:Uncharacterized protein n=1 Tax=Blattamonas nauphoetae TaxID=2049346 RepID=A0ABQ9X290_9EUKA|nr:hypothetical protein BLNAU_19372 [Blattamonas nauphoetae]